VLSFERERERERERESCDIFVHIGDRRVKEKELERKERIRGNVVT